MKYKIKFLIDASFWTGDINDLKEDDQWLKDAIAKERFAVYDKKLINQLTGDVIYPKNYVVKGWQDKIFGMSKKKFNQSYEPANS